MKVNFDSLPDHSRLWIYQCNRQLNQAEADVISNHLNQFTAKWQAHGKDLLASFQIIYNRFVVIAVDEGPQNATGCSIDDSVRVLKKISSEIDIDFFDRMKVLYKEGNTIESASMSEFKNRLQDGICSAETIVFNNTLSSLGEFRNQWEVPVKDSWHSRMLPKPQATQ